MASKRSKTTPQSHPTHTVAPKLLAQDFSAERVHEKWLADIPYVDTSEGWLYLASVLDVYARKIVGWSMEPRLHKKLVAAALKMGLGRRLIHKPLTHHSDQGSQDYLNLLKENDIQVSRSGTGNCYDNALMESFFTTLKTECGVERYATRQQARQAIFEYIELWSNRQRRPSALGYLSLHQFEQLAA